MSKVLVIGCGGVAGVAISKCCQVSEVFTELCIASRTKSKCDALAAKLAPITKTKITTAQVDADDVKQLCDLIQSYKPDLVMNIALPYQDLTIMDACLACGVNYMDTTSRRTPMTPNGAPFTKSAARKRASPPTSITAGSGHTKRSLKRPASPHCSAAALTRASRRRTAPTLKSTSSIPSIPSIFWTATAAITVMCLRQTSIRRSTCARFLRPAAIGKTATGSKSRL